MTKSLCAVGHNLRGRHIDGCVEEPCAGCLPALAADGLRVCLGHEAKVREALRELPSVWADVEASMALRGKRYGTIGRTSMPLPIDDITTGWRDRSRACLVTWVKVLEEDFDASLDGCQDTVQWMADKVGIYAGRLLASEHADQLCSDLLGSTDEDGKRHGDLWGEGRRLAFRGSSGTPQRIKCSCGTWVTVNLVDVMTCRGCQEWGDINWWRQREVGEDPAPMTLRDLSLWLALHHGRNVPERTLRGMADRGAIVPVQRQGEGVGRPSRRFDPVTVAAVVLDGHARTVMRA